MKWAHSLELEQLRYYRRQGLSYAQIGRKMGFSRDAIGIAYNRHVLGKTYDHGDHKSRGYSGDMRGYWSEEKLTEKWSDRKARRQCADA